MSKLSENPLGFLFACATAAMISAPAHAIVVGGLVTSGAGSFVELTIPFNTSTPANTVGNNTFQDPNLYAFNEAQNILIPSEITVNIGTNPQAGDIVASHYVFFDPAGTMSQVGYVDFDAAIYGVATSTSTLADSDFLLNNGVTYLNPGLRGLESGDSVWIDPSDSNRLWVDWTASTPGDYVRVFTQFSPGADVPLPASLPLLLAGMAGLGAIQARRRRAA